MTKIFNLSILGLLFVSFGAKADMTFSVKTTFKSGSPVLTRYTTGFVHNSLPNTFNPLELVNQFNSDALSSKLFKISMKNLLLLHAPGISDLPKGIMIEVFEAEINNNGVIMKVRKEFPAFNNPAVFDRYPANGAYYYCQRGVQPCSDLGWSFR